MQDFFFSRNPWCPHSAKIFPSTLERRQVWKQESTRDKKRTSDTTLEEI
jgi:hypothetical protein